MMARWTARAWGRWPEWTAYLAGVWSLVYAGLGIFWTAGGDGYPFGPVDADHRSGSLLEGAPAGVVAPVMAVVGVCGAVAAIAMARGWGRGVARGTLAGFGALLAVVLALLVPDYFVIALVPFAIPLLIFAFTGVPGPQDGLADILYWHRMNLVLLFVGGLLWAGASLAYARRTRDACGNCGRGAADGARRWTAPEAAARWGRWAVVASCLAPLPYEVTRICWFFGYPLGIPASFETMMQNTPGMLEIGLGIALLSVGGGALTHGLVRRWGEVVPRWIRFAAGRPVPRALAIVPAAFVSVALVPAALMGMRLGVDPGHWAIAGPSMLWIVWGAALGTATYAYYLRRRTACRHCGRGGARAASPVAAGQAPSLVSSPPS